MRTVISIAATVCVWSAASAFAQNQAEPGADAYWALIHEPAVLKELKLTPAQQKAYAQQMGELDLQFFPLRNKSSEVALGGLSKLAGEGRDVLKKILSSAQQKRLSEIVLWRMGVHGLMRDEYSSRMRLSSTQKQKIQAQIDETKAAVAAVEKEVYNGKPRAEGDKELQRLNTEEQKKVLKLLKTEQVNTWKELLGAPFDVSDLGQPAYRAPELIDSGEWINSGPQFLQQNRGKVIVVHFYASGCINCIRNFPWYREWHERFQDKDFVMVGIHTPETEGERVVATVRRKAGEEKFQFPVLIDGKSENWNAWGNSMWPAVYVIDRRGYCRFFWPGELKWNGNDGEKYMRGRIEQLLAESAD